MASLSPSCGGTPPGLQKNAVCAMQTAFFCMLYDVLTGRS